MIHPTANIADGRQHWRQCQNWPVLHGWRPDVVLEDGVELVSHVVVDGHTRIGAGAKLFPFCTVGLEPQDLKYKGEDTETVIGPRTQIREHCSIHRGTVTGTRHHPDRRGLPADGDGPCRA